MLPIHHRWLYVAFNNFVQSKILTIDGDDGTHSRMKLKKLITNNGIFNAVWQRRPYRGEVRFTVPNVQYEQARQQRKDSEVESKSRMWGLPSNYQ
jgi:hypothetical protein